MVQIRDNRVFHTDPAPPTPGTRGRPRRHSQRVKLTDPDSWPEPDHESGGTDPRYGTVTVTAWHGLHPRRGRRGRWANHEQPPMMAGTVIRVQVHHLPKPTSRTKKTLWLRVAGPQPGLEIAWRAYLRRFNIEHTFRFVKNTLGWTTPSGVHPEQAERSTWLVVAGYTQLRLARPIMEDLRLTWERQRKPGWLTPARVRRGSRRLAPTLGTQPAHQKAEAPAQDAPKCTRQSHAPDTKRSRKPHSGV